MLNAKNRPLVWVGWSNERLNTLCCKHGNYFGQGLFNQLCPTDFCTGMISTNCTSGNQRSDAFQGEISICTLHSPCFTSQPINDTSRERANRVTRVSSKGRSAHTLQMCFVFTDFGNQALWSACHRC